MQNNKKNFKDILNKKTIRDRIVTSARDCYFLIVFLLLREEEISLYLASSYTIIEFFQLFFFYFHPSNYTIWKAGNLPQSLGTFFGYFHLTQYVISTTYSTYIIIFYIIFLLNIVFLLLFLYIQHLQQNNMQYSSYLIYIIQQYVQLISTVFYMPFLYFFAGILYCQNGYLKYFSDVECWTGLHLLHSFFAVISSLSLAIFVLALVKTYYRSESSTTDPTARSGGKANFDLYIYKLITVISFTFFGGEDFQLIIFAIMLGYSVIVFLHFYNNSPYYNNNFKLLISVMTSINLWTIITLMLAYLAEGIFLNGTIIVYFMGVPFIIAYILCKRDINIERLLSNVSKFQTGEEIMFQVCYLQKLIACYNTNKDYAAILDGYIELHKLKCAKCKNSKVDKKDKNDAEECVMEDQTQPKNIRILKTIMINSNHQNIKHGKLIHLIYEIYMLGVKRFPNNTNLRISYSLFLIEKLKYRQQALQELNYAEENSPPFDIQFMIYRHRKLLEQEIQKEKKKVSQDDQLDIISELRYQKAFQVLHQQIEQSALSHMDFWSSLVEDTPDMTKMKSIGEKINNNQDQVEQCWKKLTAICDFKIESIIFYAKYLSEIRQDKDRADILYQRCNNLKYRNIYRGLVNKHNQEEKEVEMVEALPTITISLENEKLGMIVYCSQENGAIFGHTKNELMNKKIQDIIPTMFATRHDEFLENYLARNEFKYFKEEKTIYGKTKARYITPIVMSLKQQESIVHGLLVVGTLRLEKQGFKPTVHMLVTNDLVIDSFSSSCIPILEFDVRSLPNITKEQNLLKMFPNIMDQEFQKGKHKNSTHTDVSQIGSWSLPSSLRNNRMHIKSGIEKLFLSYPENNPQQVGYLVKFEKSFLNPEMEQQKSNESMLGHSAWQNSAILSRNTLFQFQWNFQTDPPTIIGGYKHAQFSDSGLQLNMSDNIEFKKPPTTSINNDLGHEKFDQIIDHHEQEEDYSIGFSVVRLFQGRLIRLEDFENEEEEQKKKDKKDKAPTEDSIFKLNNIVDAVDVKMSHNFNVIITNRTKLNELIQNKNVPKPIIIITRMIFILLFLLMAISFIEFFYLKSQYDSICIAYTCIQKSNFRMGGLQRLQGQVRNILLIQDGITEIQDSQLRLQKQKGIQENIQEIIQEINEINTFLSLNQINLLPDHQNLLNTASSQLYYSYDQYELHGLNDATEQILTSTLDIMSQLNIQVESQKKNIFFVQYNLFNDYYSFMIKANDYYIMELELITQQSYPILFSLLIITPVLIVFVLINMVPILISVNKQGDDILQMFLEIQTKQVQKLYEQTEKFIQDMRKDSDDNNSVGQYEKDEEDDDEKAGLVKLRKKKKFINKVKNNIHKILFKLFIGMSILEISFLYNFFRSQNQLQDTKILLQELKSICIFDSMYTLTDNIEKQMFLTNKNSKFLINNQLPIDSLLNNIHDLYILDTMILKQHSQNIETHSSTFNDVFKLLMNQNPCQLFQDMGVVKNKDECNQYSHGSIQHGISVVITHYFENIRLILTYYKKIQQSQNIVFEDEFKQAPVNIVEDTMQNYFYNLLLLPISRENEILLSKFISTTSRYLTEQFILSRNESIQIEINQRIIILIAFLFLVVLIYTFFWLPFIHGLVEKNYKNRKLLEIIPLDIIVVMRQARFYLRQLNEQVRKLQIQDQRNQQVNQKSK